MAAHIVHTCTSKHTSSYLLNFIVALVLRTYTTFLF